MKPIWNLKKPALMALPISALGLSLVLAGCGNNGGAGAGAGQTANVATVGNKSISRNELHSFLEASAGEQALTQLVDYEIVMQGLQSRSLTVTDAEVKALLDEQRKTDPQVETAFTEGGPRKEAIERLTRYRLALDKMLTKDVAANEAEMKKWFEKNRSRYDQPARVKLGVLFSTQKARADAMATQLKNQSKTFLQLVEEQKKANDPIAKNSTNDSSEASAPGMPAAGMVPTDRLPEPLKGQAEKLKPNEVSAVLDLGQGAQKVFAIIKLLERQPAIKANATDALPQLEYKLEQVARKAVQENPQLYASKPGEKPNFDQVVQQANQTVMQQAMQQGRMEQPTWRDAINFINQTKLQELNAELRKNATVRIDDPAYKRVGDAFTPATPGGTPGAAGAAPAADGHEGHNHPPGEGHGGAAAPPVSAPPAPKPATP